MQMGGVAAAVALALVPAQAGAQKDDAWAPYRFLVGTWTGEGQGQPGNTIGTATFAFELNGRILVRTKFEIAPPGSPEAFEVCAQGVTHRVGG